jgi:2-phosphoglycerate kinase
MSESSMTTPDWSVLLIVGASGTGKTAVAKAISREPGIAWAQVDDLRLLQYSDARLHTDAAADGLYFFFRTPNVWTLPAAALADVLVATGEAMTEAIAIVTGNHIVKGDPAVIEGDGILPGLLDHPELRGFAALRMVVLAPENESEPLEAMVERGRGEHLDPGTPESRRIAEMNWRFTRWLVAETDGRGIPVASTRPLKTLAARLLENL